MSVLNSLKTKLTGTKLDFSKSISLPFLSTKEQAKPLTESEAGFALLSLYQRHWSDIHRESDANASKAQEVDRMAAEITVRLSSQVMVVDQFLAELKRFAEIQTQVDSTVQRISVLDASCSDLEDKLVVLEDLCNEIQQNSNSFEHEYQLRKYRERKHLELEQVKAKFAKQHASRVQQFEQRISTQLRERQKVFEAAFVEQMHSYRTSGRVPDHSVAFASSAQAVAQDLSDIAIDDDRSALDEFLASSTQMPEPSSEKESLLALQNAPDSDTTEVLEATETVDIGELSTETVTDDSAVTSELN